MLVIQYWILPIIFLNFVFVAFKPILVVHPLPFHNQKLISIPDIGFLELQVNPVVVDVEGSREAAKEPNGEVEVGMAPSDFLNAGFDHEGKPEHDCHCKCWPCTSFNIQIRMIPEHKSFTPFGLKWDVWENKKILNWNEPCSVLVCLEVV